MAASLDGVLIKKANKQETYTNEQVEDLMKCMDPDEGYLYFARKFAHIQHPKQGKLVFDPYEYQLRLMHSYHNYRFNINMMPRQTGKTTTAAIYLCWYAMFHPDQTILIAAVPEFIQDQATEANLVAAVVQAFDPEQQQAVIAEFEQLHQQLRVNSGALAAAAIVEVLGQ